jgi:sugar phosphate isomerase/epimerase
VKTKIGIIGMVWPELDRDFAGTAARLRELGYQGIELTVDIFRKHGGPEAVASMLKAADLSLITLHTLREPLRENLSEHLDILAATGGKHITISWGPLDSRESITRDAEFYNSIAPEIGKLGARLCYHNHEHEFLVRLDGRQAIHYLLEETKHTNSLFLHLDVAWAAFAGANPVAVLECHRNRVALVHLKDLYDLTVRDCFTAVGTGLVDIAGCVRASLSAGVEWITVEQDHPRGISGFDLATASMLNLRNLGFSFQ